MNITMLKSLFSFYKRRVDIPVDSSAIVLDIGSGDKPHWRADVLLDKYISSEFGIQRSGSSEIEINLPTFDADAENMPFKDKVFDYVICSHLLEHVENPDKVIKEIVRVGKAGYIELPYEGRAKIQDFPSHLWYCKKEGNKLIFTAKDKIVFDTEIEQFYFSSGCKIHCEYESTIIMSWWRDDIDYQINGEVNPKILEEIKNINIEESRSKFLFLMRKIIISVIKTIFTFKKYRGKLGYNSIVKDEYSKKGKSKVRKHNLYI